MATNLKQRSDTVRAVNPTENSQSPEAPDGPPPGEETIRKIYVRDLREKQRVHTVFRVMKKARVTGRGGKAFLTLSLGDRTGEVEARVFDKVDEADTAFVADDYLLVEGGVISFHGKPQIVIERLQRLDPEPIDPVEFTPPPRPTLPAPTPRPATASAASFSPTVEREAQAPRSGEEPGRESVNQIRELVERVQDAHVKALLLAFLEDGEISRGLAIAPAAKGIHHAYRGGLADHILSVMRLAHRMADHYPMADRDLLVAGALLHDIDKVRELSYEKNFDYTDEGRLVGHIVMTAQKIHEKAQQIPGFPKALEHHLTHLVLAHHGQLEYGSPKLPMTLEAHIVHAIDSLDSRIASWLDLMAKDPSENWTESSKLYERHLWKGPSPTSRGKSPVEGRPPGRRSEKRRRTRGAGRGTSAPATVSRPGAPPVKDALALTFKSLDAMAGPAAPLAPPSAPTGTPESGGDA